MKRIGKLSLAVVAVALGSGAASADTSAKKIALSNNYAGNSWRQAMLRSWDKVTKEAVSTGIVAAADPFTTAENQVTEQAAQIQNLVLQGYDSIVLNATSPDALNGAVKEACDAGVTVVSFDGIVTEPCAWRIAVDFKQMGKDEVLYLAEKMPQGGDLLEIRGLAGVFVDDEISKGIHDLELRVLAIALSFLSLVVFALPTREQVPHFRNDPQWGLIIGHALNIRVAIVKPLAKTIESGAGAVWRQGNIGQGQERVCWFRRFLGLRIEPGSQNAPLA